MRRGWLNGGRGTFEEVRFALPILAQDNVDPWVDVGEHLVLVGLEVFEGGQLHC